MTTSTFGTTASGVGFIHTVEGVVTVGAITAAELSRKLKRTVHAGEQFTIEELHDIQAHKEGRLTRWLSSLRLN